MDVATRRRLQEELDLEASLDFIFKFSYQARFGELGSENELCSVYLGRTDQEFFANPNEIAETRQVSAEQLQQELDANPDKFTPWFKMEWERLSTEYADKLSAYTR